MEQKLMIAGISESCDMGCRNYSCHTTYIPASELVEGSSWIAYECDGQVNMDDPNETVHLEWPFTVNKLNDDIMEFTFRDKKYTLNRHWQVVGTGTYGIPNPMISESIRFLFFFVTDEGDASDRSHLKKIQKEMLRNADEGDVWKNIPLAKEAMHLLKDKRLAFDDDQAKDFCKAMFEAHAIDDTNTPRLYLSFLDYYHWLWNSTYYDDNRTYHLLLAVDPDLSEEEFLKRTGSYRSLKYDPIQNSPEWEEIIYEVEKELDEKFRGVDRYMGFCHEYWSAKRAALAKRGIEWRSPQQMNPRVRFD
jgi:hypothetical protein